MINELKEKQELVLFYKQNLESKLFEGYVDPNIRLIQMKGTPNLITRDGYPILALYNGLCKVMTETSLNEHLVHTCEPLKSVSSDEYHYLLKMMVSLKNQHKLLSTSNIRNSCARCGKSLSASGGYRKHIAKSPECKMEIKDIVHSASPFYEIKEAAHSVYRAKFGKVI